jgi:hypothetical protein
MRSFGLDGLGQRIESSVMRVEERLNRSCHVAVRIDEETTHGE